MASPTWDDHGHPRKKDGQHVHECADQCGAFYVCSRHDGCDAAWTCPACELDRLDHQMNQEALKTTQGVA